MLKPMYENTKLLPLSASLFYIVYIRFVINVLLHFMSFTHYFIILKLCIMKETRPSSPYRPLRFVDFLTLSTQHQNVEWTACTFLALLITQTSELW